MSSCSSLRNRPLQRQLQNAADKPEEHPSGGDVQERTEDWVGGNFGTVAVAF